MSFLIYQFLTENHPDHYLKPHLPWKQHYGIAKKQEQPSVHGWMNEFRSRVWSSLDYHSCLQKQGNFTKVHTEGPWEHYAESNRPIAKGCGTWFIPRCLELPHREAESRRWVVPVVMGGRWGHYSLDRVLQFWESFGDLLYKKAR